MYHVCILECDDGSLYTGITNNLSRRLAMHKAGQGGSYTRSRGAQAFVYTERKCTRGSALKREAAIKRLSRAEKLALVSSGTATYGIDRKRRPARLTR